MKESKELEFQETTLSKTYLKTISAFSNYGGGKIIFGVDDDGNIIGISNPENACLDIENRINDNITPQPNYELKIDEENNTIILIVEEGENKPYLSNSKAYKRNDTSTIEVDSFELTRLVLEGKKMSYEGLRSSLQNLNFQYLETKLKEQIHIEKFNKDILKTLNLYDEQNGYNNAANILSDNNTFPGIDIAKFGNSINIIKKRLILDNMSILEMYDSAVQAYRDYYQYEEIEGSYRKKVELIPEEAFRETVANALIHRVWDLNAKIRISMFDDRIEVISPGGLTNGITTNEYLSGMISIRKNPIISNVFYRLGIVEIFGTGILRIKNTYEDSVKKPIFNVTTNTIKIILPIYNSNYILEKGEDAIFEILKKSKNKSISEILPHVDYGRTKLKEILKKMEKEGVVKIDGKGRGTKYHL